MENEREPIEQDAPLLDTVEQVEVPFLDELLLATMGADGEIYVPVTPFAQHIGMAQPHRQVARIRRDDTMEEALRTMPIMTSGGVQQMQCLRIDMLTLWLATIRPNAVKEDIRPALRRYKREAARAILAYFSAKAQVQRAVATTMERPLMPALDASSVEWAAYYESLAVLYRQLASQQTTLAEHRQQLDQHECEIGELAGVLEGMKEALAIIGEVPEARISIHQANELQALVSRIHEATGMHQGTIFAAFKKQWRLPRYDELPAAQYDAAYEWLRQWGRARLPKKSN